MTVIGTHILDLDYAFDTAHEKLQSTHLDAVHGEHDRVLGYASLDIEEKSVSEVVCHESELVTSTASATRTNAPASMCIP